MLSEYYRYRRAKLKHKQNLLKHRPKDKPYFRPNVLAALGVFGSMVIGALIFCAINPDSELSSDIGNVLVAAFAIVAGLFQQLMRGEETKDDGLTQIATHLAKNGNGHNKPPLLEHKPQLLEHEPQLLEHEPQLLEQAPQLAEDVVVAPAENNPLDDWFESAFDKTLEHEGAWLYSIDTNGAPCYTGINKEHNDDWEGWEHITKLPPAKGHVKLDTPALRKLTKELYFSKYWNNRVCEAFSAWPQFRCHIFDLVVQGGHAWRLQETCKALGTKLDVDGLWGPGSKEACLETIQQHGWQNFNNQLVECRIGYFQRAVKKRLFPKSMLAGLTKRAESYKV